MKDKFTELMRGDLCTGCGACAGGGVEMHISPDGFLRPVPKEDRASVDIPVGCPGLSLSAPRDARYHDPVWGPLVGAFTGHTIDPELRHKSASGGALSAMLVSVLDHHCVDAIVQTARHPTHPMQNTTVISKTRDDVLQASGSRYAPSSPLDCLPKLLGDGNRYAFVGKPCDVAALWAMREADARIRESFPILVSFFCAGVPSLKGADEVVTQMGSAPQDVAFFDYRGPGWPGQAKARLTDGRTGRMSYARSWGGILSKHVQHRCKICADGSGVFADIAFADVWAADASGYPIFEERPGQSLILCRTLLGKDLLRDAAGHITSTKYNLEALAQIQPGQVRRRRAALARLIGLRLMGQPIPKFRGMGLWRMALANSWRDNLKNCLGMMRRTWRKRGARTC